MYLSRVIAVGQVANFWTENKDLLALIVSFAALAVSIYTSKQNLTATRKIAEQAAADNLKLAKMAAYQRIHELLVDPKAAAGRPLANIAGPVREFMAHRQAQSVQQPWAHLMGLLTKAEQYQCHCPTGAGV